MKKSVSIIGGGIAGLSLAIDLRMRGHAVWVIEKGTYPRHKVCGEYISMESHRYLCLICPDLKDLDLPIISEFRLSSTGKKEFRIPLDLGGFGISRYLLEDRLFKQAKQLGVVFILNARAVQVLRDEKVGFYTVRTGTDSFTSEIVCNASGRKSNFEVGENELIKLETNYVGIKYHVKIERDPRLIEIHNFPGGYCGISNIEEGKSCLCYIVNADRLKQAGNSISLMQEKFLFRNNNLKKIFTNAEFLFKEPLTISGINFRFKRTVMDDVFYLGDSAGSIAPITGNGMSMGLRSACVLAGLIDLYSEDGMSIGEVRNSYDEFWKNEFSARVKWSRYLQKLSEYPFLTNSSITFFSAVPSLVKPLIRMSHGLPF